MLSITTEEGIVGSIIVLVVSPLVLYLTKRQEKRLTSIEEALAVLSKKVRPAASTLSKVEEVLENNRLTSIENRLINIEKIINELAESIENKNNKDTP